MRKKEKNHEKRKRTTLGKMRYICLFAGSILVIPISLVAQKCECAQCCICDFLKKTLEVIAAGMLPAVLFAFLQDLADTKREQEDYKKEIQSRKESVKEACLNLASEILVCMNTEECAEQGLPKSFVEWCEFLCLGTTRFEEEARYFAQFVFDVEHAANELKGKVSVYKKSILERTRQPEKKNAETLVKCCRALRQSLKYPRKDRFIQNSEKLSAAVIAMFTETSSDSETVRIDPEIRKYYKEKYNSKTLAEEGEEKS